MRLLARARQSDRVKLADLRGDVSIPTVNYVVTRDSAMAAWWAMASSRGPPLTPIMHSLKRDNRTRGATDGLLRMPKDGRNIFISNMVKVWNYFPDLAAAKTPSMAAAYIRKKMQSALPV